MYGEEDECSRGEKVRLGGRVDSGVTSDWTKLVYI